MGQIKDEFAHTFRPWATDGVPSSGPNKPSKAEAAALGSTVELQIAAAAAAVAGDGIEAIIAAVRPLVDEANDALAEATSIFAPFSPFTELPALLGSRAHVEKLVATATTGEHRSIYSLPVQAGKTYEVRAVAQAAGLSFLNILGGADLVADFDLSNGQAFGTNGTIVDAKPLGNGNYACTARYTAPATTTTLIQLRIGDARLGVDAQASTGDGTSGIILAGVSIVDTANRSVELCNAPLVSSALWVEDGARVDVVVIENPPFLEMIAQNSAAVDLITNGSTPAKITELNTNDEHRLYRAVAFTGGRVCRFRARVKSNGRPRVNLFIEAEGLIASGTFNTATGSVSGTGATISSLGGGEYQIEASATATATGTGNFQIRMLPDSGDAPYLGNGSSGLYVLEVEYLENGVLRFYSDAAALVSSDWIQQGIARSIATERFQSLIQKIDGLLGGSSSPQLIGRRWAALGTSQIARGIFPDALQRKSQMVLTNLGVSGVTFSSGGDNAASGIFNQIANIPLNTEVVTVEGLINDHYFNVPLGVISDTTLPTFYGSLYAVWKGIAARVPNAAIVFIMGTAGAGTGENAAGRNSRSANTRGLFVRDYQDAMQRFCQNESVLLSALGKCCGLNDTNGNRLLSDGLHYNTAGGEFVSAYVNEDLQQMARRGMFI